MTIKRGLIASMEDLDQSTATQFEEPAVEEKGEVQPEQAQQEPVIHAEELEAQLLETEEEVKDLEAHEAQVTEAEEVAESLEALIEMGQYALKHHGGFDRVSAMMYRSSLESLASRVGLSSDSYYVSSMESFGGAASRGEATTISLEAAHGVFAKTVAAIGNAVAVTGNKVTNVFDSLFANADKILKRVETLRARLPELEGKTPVSNKFLGFRVGHALRKQGKVLTGPQAAQEWANALDTLAKNYKGKEIADVLNQFFEVLGTEDEQKARPVIQKLMATTKPAWGKPVAVSELENIIGGDAKVTKAWFKSEDKSFDVLGINVPGNAVIYQTVLADNAFKELEKGRYNGRQSASLYHADVGTMAYKKDKTQIDTLSAQEIVATLDAVEKIANTVKQIREEVNQVTSKRGTLSANLKALAKERVKDNARTEDGNDVKRTVIPLMIDTMFWRGALYNLTALLDRPHVQASRVGIQMASQYLKYCEISIKAHKEEVTSVTGSDEE